ncbi:uncharacterized protein LOC142230805 [Haematobia irritans]|uniref:uncharacterized protein LOC142230805 n=1 Tax=Haematobia irritans TaxID=7368 RepID=UPI003F5039FA
MDSRQLVISSAYFSHNDDIMPPPCVVRELVKYCKERNRDFIIGCDANAHHELDTNPRGESLMEYLLENQMEVHNRGKDYTSRPAHGISDWRVSSEISYSDHKYIEFKVETGGKPLEEEFRNPRRADWGKFRQHLKEAPVLGGDRKLDSTVEIDRAAYDVEDWLTRSFCKSCPISRPRNSKHMDWWNKDLMNLRKQSRKLYNAARKYATEQLWNEYRACLKEYKKETRKARRNDFVRVIEELSSIKDTARLRELLSKQPRFTGNLQRTEGNWTESPEETIDLLLGTHFPECEFDRIPALCGLKDHIGAIEEISRIITRDSIRWALNSFGSYKSPGMDRIYPCMLQESFDLLCDSYIELFSASLRVNAKYDELWKERWTSSEGCEQTKLIWNDKSNTNSEILMTMNREDLRPLIGIITGHNTFAKHMVRIGLMTDDICRWCLDPEATEDSYYFLCQCPAQSFRRNMILGSFFFQDIAEVRDCGLKDILAFIKASGWKT